LYPPSSFLGGQLPPQAKYYLLFQFTLDGMGFFTVLGTKKGLAISKPSLS
jgi:hypothetical protein